jgi:hypothetical protein
MKTSQTSEAVQSALPASFTPFFFYGAVGCQTRRVAEKNKSNALIAVAETHFFYVPALWPLQLRASARRRLAGIRRAIAVNPKTGYHP